MGFKHFVVPRLLRGERGPVLSALVAEPVGEAIVLDEVRGLYFGVDLPLLDLLDGRAHDRRDLVDKGLTPPPERSGGRRARPSLVLLYSLVNLAFVLRTRSGRWSPVARRRLATRAQPQLEPPPADAGEMAEIVLAAARRACGLPWVSARCVPAALSISWMLEGAGLSPRLEIGATACVLDAHMWVEIDGVMLDLAADGRELDRFLPLPGAGR